MTHNLFNTKKTFQTGVGTEGTFYSLPQLEKEGLGSISRLPISIRIVLESVLRNFDEGKKISEENVRQMAAWGAKDERTNEIPFVVARVVLQDFTGVPLLVDLAAMRSTVSRMSKDECYRTIAHDWLLTTAFRLITPKPGSVSGKYGD